MNNLFGNFFGSNQPQSTSNNSFESDLFEESTNLFGSNHEQPSSNFFDSDQFDSSNNSNNLFDTSSLFGNSNPFNTRNLFGNSNPFTNNIVDDVFQDTEGAFHDVQSKINFKPHLNDSTLSELDIKMCSACSICLEDFKIGEKACITSCGHIYHKECLEPWLNNIKKYNCPVCKKNFTTDRINTEAIDRWKNTANEQNKLGTNPNTIKNMSIKTLKKILTDHKYDLRGICEKKELIDMVHELFHDKLSIKDIKKTLDEKNISYKGCLEKSEFIRLLEVALLYDKK
jgi:hypothetical protein